MITLLIVFYVLVLAFAAVADHRARLDRLAWNRYAHEVRYWSYFQAQAWVLSL